MILRVETSDRAKSVLDIEDVRSVVIKDEHGQPILLAQVLGPGQVMVTKASDPNFKKQVEAMGIGLRTDFEVIKGHAS